ncbi:unnamed protein product [Laminaria digitata]
MRRSPWRAATSSSALLTTVALFAASMNTVTTTTAQSGQSNNNCVPYNSSSTAGNLESNLIAVPTYFGCDNGGFLVAVEPSYIGAVKSLLWRCSDSAVVGSTSSGSFADDPVSFTVGITQVQTKVEDSSLGFLSDMYIGGYDVDSSWTDIVFSWKGPFGLNDAADVLLPDASFSTCAAGSFAAGVTVWSSTNFVYGVSLECAYVTASCAPPDYPANLLEGGSDSGTDPYSSYGGTDPTIGTPSPSAGTAPTITTPSPSVHHLPTITSTPIPSVSAVTDTDPPSFSVSREPATDPPSSPGSTTDPPTFSLSTEPATDPPSSPGDPSAASDTPSPSVGGAFSSTDVPGSSDRSVSTSEASGSSMSTAAIAGASVGGAVLFFAICMGASCCLYRRGAYRAKTPQKPPHETFGTPAVTAGGGESGDGRTSQG